MKRTVTLLLIILAAHHSNGQRFLTLVEALQIATTTHPAIQASVADQRQQEALKRAAIELPKTQISLMHGQYNSAAKNDNNITISQSLPFPTLLTSQRNLATANVKASELKTTVIKNDLIFQIKSLYQRLHYGKAFQMLLNKQDSLYATLVNAVQLRYKVGEGTLLEKTAVETQYQEIQNQLRQNQELMRSLRAQLQIVLQLTEAVDISGSFEKLPESQNFSFEMSPSLQLWKQQTYIAQQQKKVEVNRMLPDLTIGYFNQTLIGFQNIAGQETYYGKNNRFQGFMVGLGIPLFFNSHTAKIKAASFNRDFYSLQQQAYQTALKKDTEEILQNLDRSKNNLAYYEQTAVPNATLLERQSLIAFRSGEIDYATFLLNLRQALSIRENHLQAMYQYNQNIINLEHLTGNQ